MDINQEEFFFGINKSLYFKTEEQKNELKKMDPEYLTRTGTDFVLLPNSPEFINHIEPFEPMYIPKQTILEESLRREIERICFADTLLNKVVFDCADPNKKDKIYINYRIQILMFMVQKFYLITYLKQKKTQLQFLKADLNLKRAIQICDYEYNLILKPDYYTTMNTQWFYFSLSNTRKNVEYRFNIINMMKPDSLYNSGMKPLMYSDLGAKYKKIGWFRDGHEICYYQNNMKRKNGGFYNTLTFAVKFQYDFDCIYIAHCYPYTYTHLCRYLKQLKCDPGKKNRVKRKQLCQTIAGNTCDFLIIGDFNNGKEKKGIVITSRVHPGETMASYVMEYMIDFLTGNTLEARILRENFIFKIVPMLNIDGVVNGNYRCNLASVDLNRQWIKNNILLFIILNNQLKKQKKKEIQYYFVIFMVIQEKRIYLCMAVKEKIQIEKNQYFLCLIEIIIVFSLLKIVVSYFKKDRGGSARIALWRELSIINCFTLEMSFCGADFGKYEYFHFNLDIYKKLLNLFVYQQQIVMNQNKQKLNKQWKKQNRIVQRINKKMIKIIQEMKDQIILMMIQKNKQQHNKFNFNLMINNQVHKLKSLRKYHFYHLREKKVNEYILEQLTDYLNQIFMNNPAWGTILGQPFGVAAYSNIGFVFDRNKIHEYQSYWPKEETGLARDVYIGFKYQCVEYARRFLTLYFKAAFQDVPHAHHIWDLETIEDCTKEEGTFPFINYPNGSKEPPKLGDLIIYPYSNEQRFGHVAVVINVNLEEQYIDLAEQNYEVNGWECPQYSRRLIIKIENGQYFLTNQRIGKPYDNWDIKEQIFGWKRIDFNPKL